MEAVIAEHELFDSCRILFGADLQVSRNFLEYLQHAGIKSAYRKKALETHPDVLASQGGGNQDTSADLFRLVHQAYANLTTYLHARDNGFRFPGATRVQPRPASRPTPRPAPPQARPRPTTASAGPQANRTQANAGPGPRPGASRATTYPFRATAMPPRKLLFGHFLYYAGVTNWQTIVKALVWQRTGRPRLGEIGRRFGWLSDEDILTILRRRSLSQPFGDSAVALGFINQRQLKLMLFQQNKLQRRFGDYFVLHNHLTPGQLEELGNHFSQHNASFQRPRSAFGVR